MVIILVGFIFKRKKEKKIHINICIRLTLICLGKLISRYFHLKHVNFTPVFRELDIAPPTACDSFAWSVRNLVFHR